MALSVRSPPVGAGCVEVSAWIGFRFEIQTGLVHDLKAVSHFRFFGYLFPPCMDIQPSPASELKEEFRS